MRLICAATIGTLPRSSSDDAIPTNALLVFGERRIGAQQGELGQKDEVVELLSFEFIALERAWQASDVFGEFKAVFDGSGLATRRAPGTSPRSAVLGRTMKIVEVHADDLVVKALLD